MALGIPFKVTLIFSTLTIGAICYKFVAVPFMEKRTMKNIEEEGRALYQLKFKQLSSNQDSKDVTFK